MHQCILKVGGNVNINNIEKIIKSEKLEIRGASYKIKKDKKTISITIDAEDMIALRTMFNALTKIMTVYKKTENV